MAGADRTHDSKAGVFPIPGPLSCALCIEVDLSPIRRRRFREAPRNCGRFLFNRNRNPNPKQTENSWRKRVKWVGFLGKGYAVSRLQLGAAGVALEQ